MTTTRPLRTMIVDDEPLAIENLDAVLAEMEGVRVVERQRDGDGALRKLRGGGIDLAFLDIQMPGLSGLEVVSRLAPEKLPWIVFVTAYDEHAIAAFEAHALDYVLKPFDDDRVRRAVDRARVAQTLTDEASFGRRLEALLGGRPAPEETAERLAVRVRGELVMIDPGEIETVEAADYCIRIRGRDESWLVRESLEHFAARLDPARFLRVHRSTVVNLDRVRRVRKSRSGSWFVVMPSEEEVPVSRPHRRELERRLAERGGAST